MIFEEGLADARYLADHTTGAAELARRVRAASRPRRTRGRDRHRRPSACATLARDVRRRADGAAAYGRTGSCLGRFGTLVAYLLDALNAVTGNLDRPGGAVFGRPPIALDDIGEQAGLATYGKIRSRIGGYPDVIGNLPATLLPMEMTTPGKGQIRAFFVSAGNPVLSVPDGNALERALEELDLMVSLDFYVNETNRHADYVLPATTLLEREDVPVAFLGLLQHAVHPGHRGGGPARRRGAPGVGGDRRPLAAHRRRAVLPDRRCAGSPRLGVRITPRRLIDLVLRTGPSGDLFGLRRSGLSLRGRAHRRTAWCSTTRSPPACSATLRHRDNRVHLDDPAIVGEIERLASANGAHAGLPAAADRHARAALAQLVDAQRAAADARRPHACAADAPRRRGGAPASATATLRGSRRAAGSVEAPVTLTDEMTPGTVALPHGWGHRRRLAARQRGAAG